jgi:hypothetical protein
MLAAHETAVGHAPPQLPQFAGSVVVSTQTPPQSVRPAGQLHVLDWQVRPPVQMLPHEPQLLLSLVTSMQVVIMPAVQSMLGAPHAGRQWPAMHCCPIGHAVPHMPQFALSVCVSAQVSPQRV